MHFTIHTLFELRFKTFYVFKSLLKLSFFIFELLSSFEPQAGDLLVQLYLSLF
jgi:hypothetical protein